MLDCTPSSYTSLLLTLACLHTTRLQLVRSHPSQNHHNSSVQPPLVKLHPHPHPHPHLPTGHLHPACSSQVLHQRLRPTTIPPTGVSPQYERTRLHSPPRLRLSLSRLHLRCPHLGLQGPPRLSYPASYGAHQVVPLTESHLPAPDHHGRYHLSTDS